MTPVFDSAESCVAPLISRSEGEIMFLGTSFSLWSSDYWLTAAHCVTGQNGNHLEIQFSASENSQIEIVAIHETADIAVLRLIGSAPFQQNYFRMVVPADSHEFEFNAFGFPEDTMGPNAGLIVPRFFKGYFQRTFDHQSHMGYKYRAAELSIACPSGLSGGPLYSTESSSSVVGIVCDNLESSLWLDTVEREENIRDNNYKMLNYGVSMLLDPVREWLESLIPKQR